MKRLLILNYLMENFYCRMVKCNFVFNFRVGNKIYKIAYKQRIRLNKYEEIQNYYKQKRRIIKKKSSPIYAKKHLTGSNKSNFIRTNTLFKARKQVNV